MSKPLISIMAALIAIMLILGSASVLYAQTVKAGVSPGDSFTYSFHVHWSSTNPGDTPPPSLIELNETAFIKITVHEVASSVVILNVTRQYRNGTETQPSQIYVNLLSGLGDGFGLIIPPNLEPKSLVYPLGMNYSNSFIINDELVKQYPFGQKTVLHTSINKTDDPNYMIVRHNLYYDKETGVMLEWIIEQIPQQNPQQKIRLVWEISTFNVKTQPQTNTGGAGQSSSETGALYTYYGIIAAAAIVVALTSALILHNRRKIAKRRKLNKKVGE